MVQYILAMMFMALGADAAPRLIAPFKGDDAKAACFTEAQKKQHEIKDNAQAKEVGAEFVCLKVERTGA